MRVRALVVTAAVGGLALLATACEPGPTTTRVSLSKGGGELRSTTFHPSISDDGTRVVFATYGAVFVRDRSAGTTTRVDVPASSGPTARTSTNASNPVISGNGRYVAFTSTENVGDCPDVRRNVYVRDLQTATTTCVSVSTGGDFGDGDSIQAAISTTGRYVTFVSRADNLVAHDDNGKPDVFLRDTVLDTTGLVSVHADGSQFNGVANRVSPVSADGDAVAFWSTDHQDENTTASVFVRVLTGSPTTELASDGDRSILNFAMSDHGRFVAFVSADEHGVNQVYVRDRDDNSLEQVSVSTGTVSGNAYSGRGLDLSSDGRYVIFTSSADNLVPSDTNGSADIFVHDRTSSSTTLASVSTAGAQGNRDSSEPQISDDGRDVAFTSLASNLVRNDTNNTSDVFVRAQGS